MRHPVPELLAPAGSLDAVRAAVANGANAVYLGAGRFNARDAEAQLTLSELSEACAIAHERGVRVYLTLNTLLKPGELEDALDLLGSAIDAGIDAVIVQDIGLIRLAQRVFPHVELHASTQLTVHDESGARLMQELGVRRVVMARENTLEDLQAIRNAVPSLGIETFVHGALCISYSGQCYMSGMISERSANRGACAQACRKDYVLRDSITGEELDRGYLISARDLAAHDQLAELARLGIVCLKIEGRKKRPEYVATATRSYRDFLDRVAHGETSPPDPAQVTPLVQIYSRGFTAGMLLGRSGRDYVTRDRPDSRGRELGTVVGNERGEVIVEVSDPVREGDGLGFEPAGGDASRAFGFTVQHVRTLATRSGLTRQAIRTSRRVPVAWRVRRSAERHLLETARASFESLVTSPLACLESVAVRVSGAEGTVLQAVFATRRASVRVESRTALSAAREHALDLARLREQFGRLGGTPFTLGTVDAQGLRPGLFLPVGELNRMRQQAVEMLIRAGTQDQSNRQEDRTQRIRTAIAELDVAATTMRPEDTLVAEVASVDDARVAAAAGAGEIVLDPFLRHPLPPVARVRQLAEELRASGVRVRLRTPTIVRPEERRALDKWLALDLPLLTGHLGLACELAAAGRDVVADYAVNCFNAHTAAALFARRIGRVTASVELTLKELRELAAPWNGAGFDVIIYGRPEGMTLEHCVLSAAFDRKPTTCRDLCVQKHPRVELTDPAGYTFPVATDSDCRNRLLHSRPIEASEFLPRLWKSGFRSFRLLFNVPGDPLAELVRAYRSILDDLAAGAAVEVSAPRALVHEAFTRGHFARAV